ncbi:putative L-type lectin-domain containing receptor kinase S.7 [Drosera capensis]
MTSIQTGPFQFHPNHHCPIPQNPNPIMPTSSRSHLSIYGTESLTRDLAVPTSSSGTVIYIRPIEFLDPEANWTASFSTRFSFTVKNSEPSSSYGDGLAFFISPDNEALGSPGGARELDAFDREQSGNTINAWIDYKSEDKKLKVYVRESKYKPVTPVLSINIDLSEHLERFMFVGFSGSTEGSTELHLIQSWSFQTSGFMPVRPKPTPHNVSGAVCCALLVVLGWVANERIKVMKKQKSFKAEIVAGPRKFSYKELKLATRGFHSSRIIGHGAFGTVYKAFFKSTGTTYAVKRSKHRHEGKAEFLSELTVIACLRHRNLVQLQGWCVKKGELLLVYELMPNGSLDKLLFPESHHGQPLCWRYRHYIAVGLASVLSYMHQECEQQVIHRDIKASNILLDENYNARLGDFGLAKIKDHDRSPVSTLTAGTMGYLAPEYLQYGKATEKTDVFSYGVVVLEMACGRRPIERVTENRNMVNLVDWVWGLHSEGKILEAADRRLNGEFDKDQMKRLLLIGLSCANPDFTGRPSMRRVLQILNNETKPMAVPKAKPTLVFSDSVPLSSEDIFGEGCRG